MLGVQAFGINAYVALNAGDDVVEKHDREPTPATRRSTSCSPGTPRSRSTRRRLQLRPGTSSSFATRQSSAPRVPTRPGRPSSPWAASRARRTRRRPGSSTSTQSASGPARTGLPPSRLLEDALADFPGHGGVLYSLACFEALGGRPEAALAHLQQAVAADPASHGTPRATLISTRSAAWRVSRRLP